MVTQRFLSNENLKSHFVVSNGRPGPRRVSFFSSQRLFVNKVSTMDHAPRRSSHENQKTVTATAHCVLRRTSYEGTQSVYCSLLVFFRAMSSRTTRRHSCEKALTSSPSRDPSRLRKGSPSSSKPPFNGGFKGHPSEALKGNPSRLHLRAPSLPLFPSCQGTREALYEGSRFKEGLKGNPSGSLLRVTLQGHS